MRRDSQSTLSIDQRLEKFVSCAVLTAALWVLSGCASTHGPEVITIPGDQYAAAFDAALQTAKDRGFQPELRDRRSGIIETGPVIAGSILEPWRSSESSFEDAVANTVNFQRRRIRFEFRPVVFDPESAEGGDDVLAGPDVLAMDGPPRDLTKPFDGTMEIRAWVWIERSYNAGRRRFSWTRSQTESSRIIDPDTGQTLSSSTWTTSARDANFERLLLRSLEQALAGPVEQDVSD